jgi:hypothetical protein
MKKRGSTCWMSEERNEHIWLTYNRLLKEKRFSVSREELYLLVAQSRTARFWVVPSSAYKTIQKIIHGVPLPHQDPHRCRMYSEILRRTIDYMHANRKASLYYAIQQVVRQPAPEFYLAPKTIKRIVLYGR